MLESLVFIFALIGAGYLILDTIEFFIFAHRKRKIRKLIKEVRSMIYEC